MSKTINEELSELASEFATHRQTGSRNWFPHTLWNKAILIAQQLSISEVSKAIKVQPFYFKKKMGLLVPKNPKKCMTFLELTPSAAKPHTVAVHIQSSHGHKLFVEGLAMSDLISILPEFLKGGTPCCK